MRTATGVALSVIVPTWNEADTIGDLLADLARLPVEHEVIVVDGGSEDGTAAIAGDAGAHVLGAPRGRGTQLRAGAEAARAPLLCFLHADVRLHDGARRELARVALEEGPGAFAFRLRVAAAGPLYRLVEGAANLRSRWFGLPYGDQGLVVRRDDYQRAGGYPSQPLMEDVELVRRLKRETPVYLLRAAVVVSARRWRRDGVLRRTIRNQRLLLRYLRGEPPERLAAEYSHGSAE